MRESSRTAPVVASAAAVLLLTLGLSAAVLHHRAGHTDAQALDVSSAAASPTSTAAIVIDSQDNETFTPATPDQAAAESGNIISASAAYSDFSQGDPQIPADTEVQEGYLTLPLGPGAPGQYSADHQLVYAYSSPHCGPALGTPLNIEPQESSSEQPSTAEPDAATLSPRDCTQWIFLEAASGEMVDMTWN